MPNETLMELFKKKKNQKQKESSWKPSEDDKVIDSKDVEKYKSLYKDCLGFGRMISKSAIKGANLSEEDATAKETDKGDYVQVYMFTPIISLKSNFKNLKAQYGKVFNVEEFEDVDGEKGYKWAANTILDKFKSKGFKKSEYGDSYVYNKEGKDDDFLYITLDEDLETISIGMRVYYKKTGLTESTEVTDTKDEVVDKKENETLTELFSKRKKAKENMNEKKHPLPKKIKKEEVKKTYTQEEVKKDIKAILAEASKILKQPEYKETYKHGLDVCPFYTAMDTAASSMSEMELYDEYESGEIFHVVDYDLWDYTKCGARTYDEEGYDEHPVNTSMYKFMDEFKKVIENKFKNFEMDSDGDWDTGTVQVKLK